MNLPNGKPKIGDCEVCDKTNIEVYVVHGNIQMCSECRDIEKQAIERSEAAQKLQQQFQVVDASIQIKPDLFNAASVPMIELRAAIENDESIPADQKEFTFTKKCEEHVKHLQQVVFEERQKLNEKENELRMWQLNGQESAGKLRADIRAQFRAFDITYQPATPKTVKTPSIKAPKASAYNRKEMADAISKHKEYGLTTDSVRMIMVSHNLNADGAAQFLVNMIKGKI